MVAVKVQVIPAPRLMLEITKSDGLVPVVLKPGQFPLSIAPSRVGTLNPAGYVSV